MAACWMSVGFSIFFFARARMRRGSRPSSSKLSCFSCPPSPCSSATSGDAPISNGTEETNAEVEEAGEAESQRPISRPGTASAAPVTTPQRPAARLRLCAAVFPAKPLGKTQMTCSQGCWNRTCGTDRATMEASLTVTTPPRSHCRGAPDRALHAAPAAPPRSSAPPKGAPPGCSPPPPMAIPCTSSSTSPLFFPSPAPSPPLQQQQSYLLHLRSPALGRRRSRAPASNPRRPPNFPPEAVVVVSDPRAWREIRAFNEEEYGSDEDDDDREEEEDDRSLDLLLRFLHNVFRKVSRRVRKAVKSVLPVPISTKLVGFSVDGVLILAFLWILKAFLEVTICLRVCFLT
ncbi:hypothetical protein Taro_005471 [Colocasia esculenta]|uniref:Uncharacterized protein n=1 Tax=Colocasia esculenta TaxID=4460 RepID=A0A843TPZ4_COLES|nr:hypothetical protein [Colocasia esculenta]